jgi:hypothetical protein
MLLFFILAYTQVTSSCTSSKQTLDCKDVQEIKIAFLPKGINTNKAISNCEDIFQYRPVLKDTVINDKEFICNFVRNINKLEKSNEPINYDFRVACLIVLKSGKHPQKLCLGEGYTTVFNDILMKDNANLFKLLDETLYP